METRTGFAETTPKRAAPRGIPFCRRVPGGVWHPRQPVQDFRPHPRVGTEFRSAEL